MINTTYVEMLISQPHLYHPSIQCITVTSSNTTEKSYKTKMHHFIRKLVA